MKVIFLNRFYSPDISATSQLLTDLAQHLAGTGSNVHVVTGRQLYDDPQARLRRQETICGVRIYRVWSTRFGRHAIAGRAADSVTFCLAAAIQLLRLAIAGDIIVAKTDPPLVSVIGAWAARRTRARLVNWLQDVFPEVAERLDVSLARGWMGRAAKRLRDKSLRFSDANVVLSDSMASAVRALVDAPVADRLVIRTIHNWADGGLVRPVLPEDNRMRTEWGLQDKFVLGYSGNIGRVHEFETLLDAAERLLDLDRIAIVFSGGGKQAETIRSEVARRGLGRLFRFEAYQPRERLAETLSVADVHLVTLKPQLEGLVVPSKIYGIAAAGRASLFVGDVQGDVARLITQAECGVAVATGDDEGLAGAIRSLSVDTARVRRMGANARKLFDARFDKPLAMAAWEQTLRAVSGSE